MEILFAPLQPFIFHPGRIATMATVLFVVFIGAYFLRRRAWPILLASVVWALYVLWERHCMAQQYNIRVDLLVIAPVLYTITAGGLLVGFYPRKPK